MKTLKRLVSLSLLCVLVLTAGCVSNSKPTALLIQPLLDKIVPADFTGDGDFGMRGQYAVVEVKAGNLHKTPDGRWTWTWLEYRQTLNIPLFSALPYRNEGWIRLGTPVPK